MNASVRIGLLVFVPEIEPRPGRPIVEKFDLPEKWQKVNDQNGKYIIDKCLKFIWINSLWKTWKKPKLIFPQPNISINFGQTRQRPASFQQIFNLSNEKKNRFFEYLDLLRLL